MITPDGIEEMRKALEEPKAEKTKTSKTKKTNMALKELVETLKNELNVNKVYCWHSIHGNWRGVSVELCKSIGVIKGASHLGMFGPGAVGR